ncbi:MipA/OmpV family protein [Microbulbifer agarilyticus]|uniref:MipA/OmpV family protein n=1 Tax=Microbulbifer agarilyticus TaxID=260552 RepID=UPI001CD1AC27|nr:MipA/OmpV family protein [Microbulbifer agarilyticus]MCA0901358.1 MipA/OmpV family protein [Microbulbifer agarilyticus]
MNISTAVIRFTVFGIIVASAFHFGRASAAELEVRVLNPPANGNLVFQVYDNPDAFGDFRSPRSEMVMGVNAEGVYRLPGVTSGTIAVLVYADENNNGALDRTFIGIPKEPIGLSNSYRPKGPPSFQRASFYLAEGQTTTIDIELFQVLGEAGQWGVGIGVIGRSSPYVGSDSAVTQVIPAITYFGERLQWVGPSLRYGVWGSDTLRFAVNATYRVGAYEESDSPILVGLGDRDSTLMAGVGLVYDGPSRIDVDFRYQHDVLDRFGGGTAEFRVSKGFQTGNVSWGPSLGVNWLSSDLANYDFGVPIWAANPLRPAYDVGSTVTVEAGVGGILEITEHWRLIIDLNVEYLGDDISDSPIVDDNHVLKGFAAITYTF